jgi:hypothetical protein
MNELLFSIKYSTTKAPIIMELKNTKPLAKKFNIATLEKIPMHILCTTIPVRMDNTTISIFSLFMKILEMYNGKRITIIANIIQSTGSFAKIENPKTNINIIIEPIIEKIFFIFFPSLKHYKTNLIFVKY